MPFRPDRAIWTVDREAALLLGAGRALLLQLAHPLVAAGVADHSRFAERPLERLWRTLDPMYTMVFGDAEAQRAAARGLEVAHRRVRGTLQEATGPFGRGTEYDAADPALRLWVHATLIDTSLLVYDRFVRALTRAEQADYYDDSRDLARVLGVPALIVPATLDAFQDYMHGMLASDTLTVGPTARRLARMIFRPPGAPALALVGSVMRFVTVGLLPPAIRQGYAYEWTAGRERSLAAVTAAIRHALPALPPLLRQVPHARAAERRLRRASRARPAA